MPYVRLENFQQFTAIDLRSDPGAIGGKKLIPNCTEVILLWTTDTGQVVFNVMHARYVPPFNLTSTTANQLLSGFTTGSGWETMSTFMANTGGLAIVRLRDVNQVDQPLISSSAGGDVGSSASPALPLETAMVVTLRTGKAGRANRGRVYVPGWATNALGAGNTIAAAAVTATATWFTSTVRPTMLSAGLTLCIGHVARQAYTGSTGTAHPARPAGTVDVTDSLVRDNHWDTQRRRGLS